MKSSQSTQITIPVQYEPVIKLLLTLPTQWLMMVEQFVRFLAYQAQNESSSNELINPKPTDFQAQTGDNPDPVEPVPNQHKDVEIINQRADYLNQETEESLSYQISDRMTDPLDQLLYKTGLLTQLGPELQKRAQLTTLSLDEVIEIMSQANGESLSEILIAQRMAKAW